MNMSERAELAAFRRGVRAAAGFAGGWDKQITGTRYRFEDIILFKFNLIRKGSMRRKSVPPAARGGGQ